jgi:hypothetical protein
MIRPDVSHYQSLPLKSPTVIVLKEIVPIVMIDLAWLSSLTSSVLKYMV